MPGHGGLGPIPEANGVSQNGVSAHLSAAVLCFVGLLPDSCWIIVFREASADAMRFLRDQVGFRPTFTKVTNSLVLLEKTLHLLKTHKKAQIDIIQKHHY